MLGIRVGRIRPGGYVAAAEILGERRQAIVGLPRQDFRFEQRDLAGIDGLYRLQIRVSYQTIPIEPQEIEGLLLVRSRYHFAFLLPFRPHVSETWSWFVEQIGRQAAGLGVDFFVVDLAVATDECALIDGRPDLFAVDHILHFLEPCRVDDRDPSLSPLRRVDPIENQVVSALIVDVDAGVAVGCFQLAVARAQNLARQDDLAAFADNFVDHNGLLLRIEVPVHGHPVFAKIDPGQRPPVVAQERTGGSADELGADVKRHGLNAALDQTVDVQISGRHHDPALSHHRGSRRIADKDRLVR